MLANFNGNQLAGLPFQDRALRAFLLTPDSAVEALITGLWPQEHVCWSCFSLGTKALEYLFTDPPDLLVVDSRMPDIPGAKLVNLIKSENVYRQLPVVLLLTPEELHQVPDWSAIEADDFSVLPPIPEVIRSRLLLTLSRASRSLDANPLSRLPGNTTIIQRIQEMIDKKQDFGLAYVDLDYFKSFNDKYGFSRGDEALLMTARIIVNTIRSMQAPFSFVGHVGGDDFVFILPSNLIESACQDIVQRFDAIIPNVYDQEDKENGYITSTDRQGNIREFPLMAVSIAVVINSEGRLSHYGEASAIAMALKKKAKENSESCYVTDRRKA